MIVSWVKVPRQAEPGKVYNSGRAVAAVKGRRVARRGDCEARCFTNGSVPHVFLEVLFILCGQLLDV